MPANNCTARILSRTALLAQQLRSLSDLAAPLDAALGRDLASFCARAEAAALALICRPHSGRGRQRVLPDVATRIMKEPSRAPAAAAAEDR